MFRYHNKKKTLNSVLLPAGQLFLTIW